MQTKTLHKTEPAYIAEMLNDSSIDAIIAVDAECNIIAWNTMAEKIYGKTNPMVLGKKLPDVIPSMNEDEETLKALNTALKGMKSFVPASKMHAHRRHAENHFIPLKDETGIKGVMNLVHDVAHRIKAEERLEYLNKQLEKRYRQLQAASEELASFTVITSTKIKEPIRHIYTGVEYLITIEAKRLTDSGKASFRRIQSSLNRMDLLLDDILNLAQISILEQPETKIELAEVIAEVTDGLKAKLTENNVAITTGNLCTVTAHRKHIALLLHHLIDNAIKFNDNAKPTVHIECNEIEQDGLLTENNSGKYYKLTLSDNGIGFNKNEMDRMFRMFEKLHDKNYKGSGMGLAVARKIMEVHEGFITAYNNETGGATFACFFPA